MNVSYIEMSKYSLRELADRRVMYSPDLAAFGKWYSGRANE